MQKAALERLSYLTIACGDADKAKIVAESVSGNYIKTKINDDIIGTEYAAMLKKYLCYAAGIARTGLW
jgi:glycerol-3-phosphate dehydrogenase (NAD(P)+)